jgi:hypothetical protein
MTRKKSTKKIKTKLNFPYKKISLKWYDANSSSGWLTLEAMQKFEPALCHSSGWIFEENDKFIKIFATYSFDKDDGTMEYGEIICVPKIWMV